MISPVFPERRWGVRTPELNIVAANVTSLQVRKVEVERHVRRYPTETEPRGRNLIGPLRKNLVTPAQAVIIDRP